MKLSQFTPTPSFFFLIFAATISVAGATIDNDAAVMSSLLKAISPAPTGWSHSTNYCSKWRGVCCSSTGRVTAINLPNLSLTGTLPSNLASLSQLTSLNLKGNCFSGQLPSFANHSVIQEIFLDHNKFASLPVACFQGLTDLRVLTMDNNLNLPQWDFPIELIESPNLVNLSMFNSHVKKVDILGTNSYCRDTLGPCDWQVMVLLEVAKDLGYPSMLADSWRGNDVCKGWNYVKCDSQEKKVEVVNFHKRHFSGKISAAFGKLTELRNLWLNDNNLIGSIPYELTLLPHLLLLNVSYNNLSGKIPKFNNSMVKLITIGNPLLLGNYSDGTSSNGTAPVYTGI
ncbi:receptor-like kinase TMK4 [Cannabis sativa]|uniref:receptor-like kinase TMK4 n=1 Tax=Cannabis sativa TaxID=3483 RepID=UPI0029CAAA7D|nr:receptor-like kinase TMK4 [Cannabis sativa]